MRKKKSSTIITLLDSPAFGGAEQYVLDTSLFFNQHGHKIFIFTNNDHVREIYLEKVRQKKLKNFTVLPLPYVLDAIGNWKGLVKFFFYLPGAGCWFYRMLKDLKNKEESVVCFFVGFSDRLVFSPLIKKLKAKLIWVEIGPLRPVFKRNWGFPKLLYHLTKKFPDHFATTSRFTLESMVKEAQIDRDDITLVYPGINLFTPTKISKYKKTGSKLRKKQTNNAEILVGFVGRMATENEVDLLIRAFAQAVKHTDKKMHLLLMGDGPERERLTQLVKTLSLEKLTTLTGFVSSTEKFSWLAVCDLFVFPRAWSWEGFGITTIEAMTVGTPVISPRFGPQQEIVKDRQNGLNFNPHDPGDLAKKIIILAENQHLRKKFSQAGLKTVKSIFSYQLMEKNLIKVINQVI